MINTRVNLFVLGRKAVLEDEGRSMSDDLREHVERVVAEQGTGMIGGEGPGDPQLADAYRALWRNANPDTHRLIPRWRKRS